jgi:shikimate dehydrogenase
MTDQIDGETQLVGLIGWPVGHSLSPAMHNAAFATLGLNWRYVPLPVRPERLADAVRGLAALGFRGVNVTAPHKVAIMSLLDAVDESARLVGAVNTIQIDVQAGHLTGLNTDGRGFLADLMASEMLPAPGARVIVLGAGGAARAVGAALIQSGARVTFVNRTLSHAEGLVGALRAARPEADVRAVAVGSLPSVSGEAALIVNTTPLGMWPDTESTPWPESVPLPPDASVYDTVYRPVETRLVREARLARLRATGGIGMLVRQGAAALTLWTGHAAPLDVMRAACDAALRDGASRT